MSFEPESPPPSPISPRDPFRIGEIEVRPASNEIVASGSVVRLRPLLMQLLLRLAAEPGEVVRREILLAEAWPRRMVADEVLSRTIAELRTALGDEAKQARYIETLPKAGYRLIAPVTPVTAGGAGVAAHGAKGPGAAAPARNRWREPMAALVTVVVVITIAVVYGLGKRDAAAPAPDLPARLAAAMPFASDVQLEIGPRFSPDGTRIAYALGQGSATRLVIRRLDGTVEAEIGRAPEALRLSPVFFPDGKRIAYWRRADGQCAIVEHEISSGRERTIVDCAQSPRSRFDLTPDGKSLVVTMRSRAQYPSGLSLVDVATGAVSPLTQPEPGRGDDLLPRVSPDSRRVLFFRGSESHRELWMMELANPDRARRVLARDGLVYGAAWLDTGSRAIVAADWFGARALNLVDLDSGKAELLGARGARFPDASAKGDLVWENAQYSANLWRVDLADRGAAPRELWASTRYTGQPEFSPDGRHVAFASNREGHDAIYVAPLEGEARRVPLPSSFRYMRPHWSADGKALYAVQVSIEEKPKQRATRATWPEGRIEVLEHLGTSVNDVRESADGRWIYVGEMAGHAVRVVRTPREGASPPVRLPVPVASEFQLSRDRLVFSQPQLTGLTSCRLDGSACEQVDVPVGDANRFHWQLAGAGLLLKTGEAPAFELARYDLAARRFDWRMPFAPTTAGSAITVDPSGRTLLVAREAPTIVDLMLSRREK